MADLLAKWLNEEVGLSKDVSNFEDDFASGYLLGELLYKFNQQNDFQNFSTKNATSHYVMNFEKLEPTLRSLNVQFNSKTVEKIMSRERGQSLRLLYQLKMVLEKVYPPADISIVAKTGTFGDNQPAQRIAVSKPKYDEVSHNFFKQRLGKLNRAQKDIDLEAHLQKFDDEAVRQANVAERADKHDSDDNAREKQEMRRIQINKLQRNAGFMEEWLAKGVEDWKGNMEVKRTREASQLEFDFTEAEKYNQVTQSKLKEAQDEVYDGIAEFTKNLKAKGISTKVLKEDADRAITQTLSGIPWQSASITMDQGGQPTLAKTFDARATTKKGNFTLTSTGLKQRTKKTVTDEQRIEREKRRRRLINQQTNLYVNIESETREKHVTELMKRQARQERELDYEAWRTTQCKNIIIENRKLRETQYERRRVYDVELGIEKEENLIVEMQEASKREMEQMTHRYGELQVFEQSFKLKQRTELCQGLMDTIFDIADEAYNHMQDLDTKEWDTRNWSEWQKLFINKKQVAGTMAELLHPDTHDTENQVQLDKSELIDYLTNQNQWPTTLVSENKINLAEIMNPKVETSAPVKGGKPAGKAVAQAETVFEEADLEVTDTPMKNHIFGDVVDQLIKLFYPPRADLKHPPTPNHLALKLCLIGYPFAGKKTQAQLIKEKYGLDVYCMDILVQEAIDSKDPQFTQLPKPIEDDASDFANLSQDEYLEQDINQEFAEIGALIREQLLDGQEISDELYVRLFICKLRTAYEYKCPVTKRNEIKGNAQRYVEIQNIIADIQTELLKEDLPKKERKRILDEQVVLDQELVEMNALPTNGWVLVDFPCSYAQAKLLEEALSGYKPHEELEPTEREIEIKDALLLIEPHAQQEVPKTLIKSGLDAVVWFDCSTEECLRRSDGRRFDSADLSNHYHVFDMKPPTDQAPLCERLLPLSEDNNQVQGLPDRFLAFDQQNKSLQRWLKQFGDEKMDRVLLTVLKAEDTAAEVQHQISGTLDLILHHRQLRYETTKQELASKINVALETEKSALEVAAAEQHNESIQSVVETQNPRLSPQGSSTKQIGGKRGSLEVAQPSVQQHTESVQEIKITFTRDNVEIDFRPVLIQMWQELSKNYKSQMCNIFRNFRRNRENQFKSRAVVQQKFLTYLHRCDNKQELLDQFVRDFNQFSDEFPDLREDPQTKDELHQRCDVLSDELWEIVEERKEHNVEERKKVMESGAVENALELLTLISMQLMQAELDKFKSSTQILHDYYFAIEEKPTHEITQPLTCELSSEGDDMPAVEIIAEGTDAHVLANFSYPRLDRILQQALKNQVVPDVTAIQANTGADKKGGKAPPPKKGAVVKEAEAEAASEESQYVKEMREAVRVEKQILRFRLVQIRNWTLKKLQFQRQCFIDMYKKFDDWILVATKTEMDTIDEMSIIIKKAIEDESKIQLELRIKFMDFTVDHSVLNYIDPPIPKLEALENYSKDRFSIPQMHCVLEELELISRSTGDLMQTKDVVQFLYSRVKNSKTFASASSGLPESWNSMGLVEINQIIRNIDSKNSGYVNWRTLITYMMLLKSQVASATEISRIEKMLGDEASQADFVKGTFWFDQSEKSNDRENAIVFERVNMIKELLFKAHSSEGVMNVRHFSTCLGQISQKASDPSVNYQDALFSKVRI